jgi:hypothetical protein
MWMALCCRTSGPNSALIIQLRRLFTTVLLAGWLVACAPAISQRPMLVETQSALNVASPRAATGSTVAMAAGTLATMLANEELTPSVTAAPSPISPYPDGCMDARQVSLKEVGQTLCVGGLVFLATQVHGDMYIAFSSDQAAFYMVGYEWVGGKGFNAGDCIYANALVENLGSVPIMQIHQSNVHRCTPKPFSTPTPPPNLPAGCRFALALTMQDYGKPLCVGGTVAFVNPIENASEVYFSLVLSQGLHFIIHNTADDDRGVHPGDCVFVANQKVDRLGQILVMAIRPADLKHCPDIPPS